MRYGRFTSSQIYKLMTWDRGGKNPGQPFFTYVEEKRIERKMQRSLELDVHTRPMAWGNLCEMYVEQNLGFEYEIVSKDTIVHPDYDFWAGTPDFKKPDCISELKCYEPKKFASYTDCILKEDKDLIKAKYPEEYWQGVSNAILLGKQKFELITFIPYKSELDKIREFADNYDGPDQWKYRYIVEAEDKALPYIPDRCGYKNLNIVMIDLCPVDAAFLTERVLLAEKYIIQQV